VADAHQWARDGQMMMRDSREGDALRYDKVDTVTDVDPAPYVGCFCGVDTNSCITISAAGRSLRFSGPRWSDQPLKVAYRDVFVGNAMLKSSDMVLKFKRGLAGRIDSVRLGDSRAYDLLFQRTK
jgi:hypothetical protein